jgi:hypothetical protein
MVIDHTDQVVSEAEWDHLLMILYNLMSFWERLN